MTWKLSILILCVTVIVHINAIDLHEHEEHGPAVYEFHYSVNDPHTGDIKSQKESRNGDKVEGQYELIEPDGHRRIVQYKSDHHSGFEAIVHREATNIKIPQPEPQHKVLHAKILAPVVHYSHAPQEHHYDHHAEHPQYENHVSFSGPNSQYKY